jgi:hypothetical protein
MSIRQLSGATAAHARRHKPNTSLPRPPSNASRRLCRPAIECHHFRTWLVHVAVDGQMSRETTTTTNTRRDPQSEKRRSSHYTGAVTP